MTSNARSMIAWTSSGSRRSDMAVKPDTSANMTVTLLRSPSSALLDVRIFCARCFGVYDWGDAYLESSAGGPPDGAGAAGATVGWGGAPAVRCAPHSLQNLLVG